MAWPVSEAEPMAGDDFTSERDHCAVEIAGTYFAMDLGILRTEL